MNEPIMTILCRLTIGVGILGCLVGISCFPIYGFRTGVILLAGFSWVAGTGVFLSTLREEAVLREAKREAYRGYLQKSDPNPELPS